MLAFGSEIRGGKIDQETTIFHEKPLSFYWFSNHDYLFDFLTMYICIQLMKIKIEKKASKETIRAIF